MLQYNLQGKILGVWVSPLPQNRVTEGHFCSVVLGMQFGNSVACLINVCPLIPATGDGIKYNWIWQTEFVCCVWGTAKQPGEKNITANYAFLSPYANSARSAWRGEWTSLRKDNTHQAQTTVLPWSDSRAGDVGTGEGAEKSQLIHFPFLVPLSCLVCKFGAKDCFPARLAPGTLLWVTVSFGCHNPVCLHCPPLCQGNGLRWQCHGQRKPLPFFFCCCSIVQCFWSTLTMQIHPTVSPALQMPWL